MPSSARCSSAWRPVALAALVALQGGCATSAGIIGLGEAALQASVGARSTPHATDGLGWRASVDWYDVDDATETGVSADVMVPLLPPAYFFAGGGIGTGDLGWTLGAGLGTEFDLRQRGDYFYGIFADGGWTLLRFDDDDREEYRNGVFARVGIYFCFKPIPC